ncbi:MAG: cell division protein FtsI (penicillin-binding protein 3) [Psychrosphaera sp.]|jgi:cell division protein FtsI (penicillin-binding protein 3)|uniref:Peptidoglycan D,D-transpeptidase FtsI n=1 Tax=Psychrosphaera aquimarina TaxID=2044854 RepID=A0ABU3R0L8_9GAMM|nr:MULTISPECIES: penicillin-binding transpeptidase domain-containing protein [Psychrosphaera]MBU2916812.1 peptidoglycan glycosyltransferase FtsI [Psychrosphaera sp. F3M07]MDU0113208.1 penicillin-binding transpeptidase domain-containing protein [Psychrosphaera aquimarina]
MKDWLNKSSKSKNKQTSNRKSSSAKSGNNKPHSSKSNKQAKQIAKPGFNRWRFQFVVVSLVLVFGTVVSRAAYLQIIQPDRLRMEGDNRTVRIKEGTIQRGMITDRNGVELAVSVPVQTIWADPKQVLEYPEFETDVRWEALAKVLDMEEHELLARITNNAKKRFIYLKRKTNPVVADYVEQLRIPGVRLREESKRYYPAGEITAHIVGFTNIDGKGIEGVELRHNDWMVGTPSKRKIIKDAKGREIEVLEEQKGSKPQNVVLTIDQRIQSAVYQELKKAVQTYEATSGSAIVVDVKTAEVLAMVNSPSFNPNNRNNVPLRRIRNRAITDTFEPGSTVKPLSVINALDYGSYGTLDLVDTSPGYMRIGGSRVSDPRNRGQISLADVLKYSSNMGSSKLALSTPKESFLDIFYRMGLVDYSGLDLVGESTGIFNERRRWSDIEVATLSYGYGISVTAAQLVKMYTTIGAGGISKPLSIVKTQLTKPEQQVISKDIANDVLNMMESVVSATGSGKRAIVKGYRVAGKTGTSIKAVGGGYGNDYVNVFAGVGPVSNPEVAVVVVINEPKGDYYYGGETAAPTFAKIMRQTLRTLNVAPDALGDSKIQLANVRRESADE